MSYRSVLICVLIAMLCLRMSITQKVAAAIPQMMHKRCTQDHDCPSGQFCKDNNNECDSCINCKDHNRNMGLRSSCLKDVAECGSCLDGYDEVRARYDHSVKSCMKRTELSSATKGKRDFVLVEGSSEEAPSHTTATVLTIGIVFIAVGAVSAAMIGVYMYMKRSHMADAGQIDDDDDKKKKKGKKDLPRVVELQTIVHANPNLARRQQSEDEIHALKTEISPISSIEEEEINTKQSNQSTLPLNTNAHNNKDTIALDEE